MAEEPDAENVAVKTADVLVAPWTMRDASSGEDLSAAAARDAVSDDEIHKGGDVIAASAARGS